MTSFVKAAMEDQLFRHYLLYNGILVVKVASMSLLTGFQRHTKKTFANIEDANMAGGKVQIVEDVERVRRAHLNDLENIPIYFVASFAYICTNPSVETTIWLMRAFVAARITHSIVYAVVPVRQPARGLAFGIGFGITGYMAISAILHFM